VVGEEVGAGTVRRIEAFVVTEKLNFKESYPVWREEEKPGGKAGDGWTFK
jgi:hypothetical protein